MVLHRPACRVASNLRGKRRPVGRPVGARRCGPAGAAAGTIPRDPAVSEDVTEPDAKPASVSSASGHRPPRRVKWVSRAALRRLAVLALVAVGLLVYGFRSMVAMPGTSFRGPLPPPTDAQRSLATELRNSVAVLADAQGGVGRVGNRSTFYPRRFAAAAAWLRERLLAAGYAEVSETFVERGAPAPNLAVELPGTSRAGEIVVVGAHYDAFQGTPGADDNASGVAATLALAGRFGARPQSRTLRFVLFVNEEPPAFWTRDMGSWVYARACRERGDDIVAMISLESIGYYSEAPGSQRLPAPLDWLGLYPDTGDFIAFVSNWSSRSLNKRAIRVFREHASFPSEGGSPPGVLPGVGWSDHWSFWQEGYRAIMVTDTATFRNPNYHTPQDRVDTLDFDRMSRVVEGVEAVVSDLANN